MDFKGLVDQDILDRFTGEEEWSEEYQEMVLQAQLIKTNKELLEIIRSLVIIKIRENNNA